MPSYIICRCGSNAACIPVVEQTAVLPTANMVFKVSDIIGRCNSYCTCPETIALVCGGDGQTYQNSCFAQCAGVEVSLIIFIPLFIIFVI